MPNLAFPQLSSGAEVQFPFRKRRLIQSAINAFADGRMITSALNADLQRTWQLGYKDLTTADQSALLNHFTACNGPLRPFIFIDPAQNMLNSSIDLKAQNWVADTLLSVVPGQSDPQGGNSAFLLINSSQITQSLTQQLNAPAGYQYCFSVYASASDFSSLSLVRTANTAMTDTFNLQSGWRRLVSSGKLAEQQVGFTVSISIPAAQSLLVWGPQLEPQLAPSRYRPTVVGGVYQNAHFLGDSLSFQSEAPGLFSTFISIETT